MNNQPLPRFLEQLIAAPPAAGTGVHDWLFDVARNLHAHWPASQIEALLRSRCATCGRPVPDREIKAAIKNAIDYAWRPKEYGGERYAPGPPKLEANLEKIERLVRAGARLADLWESSPVWYKSPMTEALIDQLFPGNPLLCCGLSVDVFNTRSREWWLGKLEHQQFIVPSPMTAITGMRADKSGISEHTLDNTGPRRFLVIEFDFSKFSRDGKTPTKMKPMLESLERSGISVKDMCAALLLLLHKKAPLTLAVDSGGKSIHGWWYCYGQPEEQLKTFFDYAVTLGADPKTWFRQQFIRMPDGKRSNGKPQQVLYFDPSQLTK